MKVYARLYGALAPPLAALAAVLSFCPLVGPPFGFDPVVAAPAGRKGRAGRPHRSGAGARRRVRHGARAARAAAARRARIRKRKG